MGNMNAPKLTVNRMRKNDDEITLSQMTFSLAELNLNRPASDTVWKRVNAGEYPRKGTGTPKSETYETLGYLIDTACVKMTHV